MGLALEMTMKKLLTAAIALLAAGSDWSQSMLYGLALTTTLAGNFFLVGSIANLIVAERAGPVTYTAEELYFGPLLMREKAPAFVTKWQRMLRQKQQTLANFERARDAIPEEKRRDFDRQITWITQVLA